MKIAFTPIYAIGIFCVHKFILYFLCMFTEIDSIHNYNMCNWKFLKWRNKI